MKNCPNCGQAHDTEGENFYCRACAGRFAKHGMPDVITGAGLSHAPPAYCRKTPACFLPDGHAGPCPAAELTMPTRTVRCPGCGGEGETPAFDSVRGFHTVQCRTCWGHCRVNIPAPVRVAPSYGEALKAVKDEALANPEADAAAVAASPGIIMHPRGLNACPTCDGYGTILTLAKATKICPTCQRTGKAPTP